MPQRLTQKALRGAVARSGMRMANSIHAGPAGPVLAALGPCADIHPLCLQNQFRRANVSILDTPRQKEKTVPGGNRERF